MPAKAGTLPSAWISAQKFKLPHKRLVRLGVIFSNLAVLAAILFIVISHSGNTGAITSSVSENKVNPLDQLSSADIALTVASISHLPETTSIANQAQSAAAEVAMANTSNDVVAKPEVVATALKSKADIENYTTSNGDTVTSLANKFGITSTSIMWSNGLTSDAVKPGTTLTIPPINGIVYTVKAGDTPDTLAVKFKSNSDQIIAFNDAEANGIKPGEQILIPNAVLATSSPASSSSSTNVWPFGSGPIYGYNGYDYGFCTWYVATQIPVPSNWGNASTWSYYASMSGWNVSSHPTVGAIAQTPYAAGGEGHVAIVDAVSPDGSQIQIRDMNGIAGWGRVGYSGWIPVSTFVHYITP